VAVIVSVLLAMDSLSFVVL